MSELGIVRALRPVGGVGQTGAELPHQTHPYGNVSSHSFNGGGYGQARAGAPPSHVNGELRRRVTDEELELLVLLADGLPVEAIARRLALSDRTVRRRSRAMCDRLGARAPIQVVAWAARQGLI